MKTAPQYVHSNVDAWPIFSLLGPKLGARPPPERTSQKGLGGSEVAADIIVPSLPHKTHTLSLIHI